MTFLADATASTVGGSRRAATVELHTSDGGVGAATMSMPAGLADAVVSWVAGPLSALAGRPFEPLVGRLGDFEAEWNDLAAGASQDRAAARYATALVTDAMWDLWARSNDCPLWKLVVNLSPDHLVRSLDLRWVEDILTEAEARELLDTRVRGRSAREADLRREGYPVVAMVSLAHTDSFQQLEAMSRAGWPAFHVAVEQNSVPAPPAVGEADRASDDDPSGLLAVIDAVRARIGPDATLALGPDRFWMPRVAADIASCIADAPIDALIEPVDPLDLVALSAVRKRLSEGGRHVEVVAGGTLSRPLVIKQLLAAQAVDRCRVDPGRHGISATLTLLLVAARLRIPMSFVACADATGPAASLDRALHAAAVDNIAIGASLDRRAIYLGPTPDLLAAALTTTAGRCRLPLHSGAHRGGGLGFDLSA